MPPSISRPLARSMIKNDPAVCSEADCHALRRPFGAAA
jgi:hypothetical protein